MTLYNKKSLLGSDLQWCPNVVSTLFANVLTGLSMQWSTTGWHWKPVTLVAADTSVLQWLALLRSRQTSSLSTSWTG